MKSRQVTPNTVAIRMAISPSTSARSRSFGLDRRPYSYGVLSPAEMIVALVGDVDGLREEWAEWRRDYYRPAEPPQPGQVCFELWPALRERMQSGRAAEVASVFANLEGVLPDADRQAVDMVLWQIIESLQNAIGSDASESYDDAQRPYVELLGPLGREAWAAVNDYWQGDMEPANRILDRAHPGSALG